MKEISTILKKLRTERGLTQQELATYLNKTRATYCRYENGTLKPDIDTLLLIAKYYNTSLDYLVGRYEK